MGMRKISNEEGLKLLKEDINKIGHIPSNKEISKLITSLSHHWYLKRFGTFDNALIKIGVNVFSKSKVRSITKEDLIKMLQDKYRELGKSPTSKEIKNPSAIVYYKRFNTKSWNEILQEAGLSINHTNDYSNEFGLENLKELYNKLGKIPTKEDFKKNKWIPNHSWYAEHFGSMDNALYKVGIIDQVLTDKERIKISINELIKLADILNKCPTVKEYEKLEHKGFVRRDLERHLNLKYNNICRKYLPQYELNNNQNITKEDVYDSINKMYKDFNHIIPMDEYFKLPYSYSFNVFNRLFNKTYGETIRYMGYKTYGITTIQKSDERLLKEFLDLFNKLQRIPLCTEFIMGNNISSYGTYIKKFKNLKNVCDLLDIDWYIYNKREGRGKILFDKNNEICRSAPEIDITNYFIDNNVEYRKEVHYDEILEREKNRNTSRRLDWVLKINKIDYYVEYFGMYYPTWNSKTNKKYIKKAKKKIKDLYKEGLIKRCIFIFPNDIKCNNNDWLEQKLKSFFMLKYNIDINNCSNDSINSNNKTIKNIIRKTEDIAI